MQSFSPIPRSPGLESVFQQDPQSSSSLIHICYRDLWTWVLYCGYFSFHLLLKNLTWNSHSQFMFIMLQGQEQPIPAYKALISSHSPCPSLLWPSPSPMQAIEIAPGKSLHLRRLIHTLSPASELIAHLLLLGEQGSQPSAKMARQVTEGENWHWCQSHRMWWV